MVYLAPGAIHLELLFVESGGDESESTETNLLGHRAKDLTLETQFEVHFEKAKSIADLGMYS